MTSSGKMNVMPLSDSLHFIKDWMKKRFVLSDKENDALKHFVLN